MATKTFAVFPKNYQIIKGDFPQMKSTHPLESLVNEQTSAFNNPAATMDDRMYVYRKIQDEQKRLRKEER